ncbi:MAG: hypothetical protein J6X44_10465, partial [Thermoguttaceae bacterium]|nr:hypothetical protein [Thermoguttaceae bacterium]
MKRTNYLLTLSLAVSALVVFSAAPTVAQESVVAKIDSTQKGEPISPFIYGQFIEHLGRCIYGGIWSEMLLDRKFHDAPAV